MKGKLNFPIPGLFAALEGIAIEAVHRVIPWNFTSREYSNRMKQTPAKPEKKARRKMIQVSQRRNRR